MNIYTINDSNLFLAKAQTAMPSEAQESHMAAWQSTTTALSLGTFVYREG